MNISVPHWKDRRNKNYLKRDLHYDYFADESMHSEFIKSLSTTVSVKRIIDHMIYWRLRPVMDLNRKFSVWNQYWTFTVIVFSFQKRILIIGIGLQYITVILSTWNFEKFKNCISQTKTHDRFYWDSKRSIVWRLLAIAFSMISLIVWICDCNRNEYWSLPRLWSFWHFCPYRPLKTKNIGIKIFSGKTFGFYSIKILHRWPPLNTWLIRQGQYLCFGKLFCLGWSQ